MKKRTGFGNGTKIVKEKVGIENRDRRFSRGRADGKTARGEGGEKLGKGKIL